MSMLSCCAVTATEAATVLQSECLVAFPAKLLSLAEGGSSSATICITLTPHDSGLHHLPM